MSNVGFSYERFCEYVRNKMSTIYQNEEGQYEILEDTQPLQQITPDELGWLTEEETLKYIYDNNLFEEMEKVILTNHIPHSYYDKVLRLFQEDRREFKSSNELRDILSGKSKELKYRLLDSPTDTLEITNEKGETIKLYRIQALKQIGHFIPPLQLGGFVQSEKNLSHEGECWIKDDAMVYENAKISDNAIVTGKSVVRGNAKVIDDARILGFEYGGAQVYGNAIISGNAEIYNDVEVFDNAIVSGDAKIMYGAKVYDNAKVFDEAKICSQSEIYGNAVICGKTEVVYDKKIFGDINHSSEYPNNEIEDDWELEP